MYYAPHILQKRIKAELEADEFGRPLIKRVDGEDEAIDANAEWVSVCKCRCDHNRDTEIKKPDGSFVKPEYHIICEGNRPSIAVGDYVRCIRQDGSIRGEGYVQNTQTLNYLPYVEIYC